MKVKTFLLIALVLISFVAISLVQKSSVSEEAVMRVNEELFYPSMNSRDYYDKTFKRAKPLPFIKSEIAIVNHHLFAPQFIASTLESISNSGGNTVVLISPDHFNAGSADITLCDRDWDTPYGKLESDKQKIRTYLSKNVALDCEPFREEHGVRNVVAFIKHAFPNSKIIPLIVKESTDEAAISIISEQLRNHIIVGSFDFTHEQDIVTTRLLDKKTFEVLKNIDTKSYEDITVDSKKGALLVMEIAKRKHYSSFIEYFMTSSAELIGKDSKDNTSYIDGVFY